MSWNVVAFDEVAPQPWRNGGGITRELLAWPSIDNWIVRVSVADITRDGPFSAFAGVDRWFAVLEGEGVQLGDPTVSIRRDGVIVNFPGESAPSCTLIDGATRDLNLMLRRGRCDGFLRRLPDRESLLLEIESTDAANTLRGVFSVDGGVLSTQTGGSLKLPAMSMAWCLGDAGAGVPIFAAAGEGATFELVCIIDALESPQHE